MNSPTIFDHASITSVSRNRSRNPSLCINFGSKSAGACHRSGHTHFPFGKTTPFGDHRSTERGIHGNGYRELQRVKKVTQGKKATSAADTAARTPL